MHIAFMSWTVLQVVQEGVRSGPVIWKGDRALYVVWGWGCGCRMVVHVRKCPGENTDFSMVTNAHCGLGYPESKTADLPATGFHLWPLTLSLFVFIIILHKVKTGNLNARFYFM